MVDVELVWDPQCSITESPVWDLRTRRVLFGDLRGARILAYGVDDGKQEVFKLPERFGSIGLCASGRLVVAMTRRIVLFDLVTGDLDEVACLEGEPEINKFSDGRPGPDGCYWVGTRDGRREQPGGRDLAYSDPNAGLYRITPAGTIERKAHGFLSANGLAFSPDGTTMYFSDSSSGYVDAWDFDPTTGDISNRRRFLTLTNAVGRPDGAAIDVEGRYWSAGVSAGCVNCFSPSGELIQSIDMPCAGPTMPCFAEDYVYVTSLSGVHQNAEKDMDGYPHNIGALFRFPAPVKGAPVGVFVDQ